LSAPAANSRPETPNPELGDWFSPHRFAAYLLLAFVVAFPGIWMGTETFFRSDYGVMAYPSAHYLRESLRAGELPLWNPLSNCGAPFLAQWGTMCLYPGSLFFVALPMPWALGVFCLLHLWLGGLGARALAERWTGNRFAAAVAGTAFAINGASLACITWPNYCVALGWLPWVVLLTEQAWREGGRKLVLAALAGTMQMLTGVPELVVMTWGLLGVMLLAEWVQSPSAHEATDPSQAPTTSASLAPTGGEGRGEGAGYAQPIAPESHNPSPLITNHYSLFTRFLLVIALIAALSAAQLLPFFDLLAHSQRAAEFRDARWPMPPWGWANFLVPLFRYGQTPQGFWIQVGQEFLSSYYLGLAPLALALLAVWKARERRVWLLAGATAFVLVMALGDAGFLYTALKNVLPGSLIARFPVKFVLLAAFTVPLLAAFGVAWLTRNAECGTRNAECADEPLGSSRREEAPSSQSAIGNRQSAINQSLLTSAATSDGPNRSSALLAICLALVVGMALTIWLGQQHPLQYDRWPETRANALARLAWLAAALGAIAVVAGLGARAARERLLAAGALLVLLAADPLTHQPNQTPRLPAGLFAPGLARAQTQPPPPKLGEGRVMITPQAEAKLLRSNTPDWASDFAAKRLSFWSHLNLLDGVPKVNGSSTLRIREQDAVQEQLYGRQELSDFGFPWLSYLAIQSFVASDGTQTSGPRRRLEGSTSPLVRFHPFPPSELGLGHELNFPRLKVAVSHFGAHEVLVRTEANGHYYLSIAQSYYPAWKATIDGHPTELLNIPLGFQCVAVPAGSHTVRLIYEDQSFRFGCMISLLGLTLCGFQWSRAGRMTKSQ